MTPASPTAPRDWGDFGGLLESAQQALSAQAEAADQVVTGTAGGGVVSVEMTGGGEVRSVTLSRRRRPRRRRDAPDLIVAASTTRPTRSPSSSARRSAGWATSSAGCRARLPSGRARARGGGLRGPVQDLIDELGRLPGVGPKSAQRIAFHLLKLDKPDALRLARAIVEVKDKVSFCRTCFNVAEGDECGICADPRRDHRGVRGRGARDLVAVEKTGEFSGRYHVLQGAISPIEGIGPDQLRVRERCSSGSGGRGSPRSSSAPIPTSRARPRPCTSAACSSRSGSGDPDRQRPARRRGPGVRRRADARPCPRGPAGGRGLTLTARVGWRTQVRRPDSRGGRTGPTTGPAHLGTSTRVQDV